MLNEARLIGHLGETPRMTEKVCTFSVATSRRWRKEEKLEQETEWHRVVAFGELAQRCAEYLAKGEKVYVEGRLKTSDYTDRDGIKRYSTEIIASRVLFLDGKADKSDSKENV